MICLPLQGTPPPTGSAQSVARQSALAAAQQLDVLHLELQQSLVRRAELETELAQQQAAHATVLRELDSAAARAEELTRRLTQRSTDALAATLRRLLRLRFTPCAALAFSRWASAAVALDCEAAVDRAERRLVEAHRATRASLMQQARGYEVKLQELAGEAASVGLLTA